MKKVVLTIIIGLFAFTANAQKVKLKRGEVLLDGNAIFKFEREVFGVYKIHLYSLESDDEIIEINKNDNETSTYYDDDFVQIRFLSEGKLVELKMDRSFKKIIQWIIKKKVIMKSGKINKEKLDLFIKNYHENITSRTFRN
ncbi:MAG: hypothetical protein AB8B65_02895 [Kordia sp.]|uniref:hypothetical protein n=1 Tax=Kordia sp. TaxID=1965332 RepID=UPI00385A7B28